MDLNKRQLAKIGLIVGIIVGIISKIIADSSGEIFAGMFTSLCIGVLIAGEME